MFFYFKAVNSISVTITVKIQHCKPRDNTRRRCCAYHVKFIQTYLRSFLGSSESAREFLIYRCSLYCLDGAKTFAMSYGSEVSDIFFMDETFFRNFRSLPSFALFVIARAMASRIFRAKITSDGDVLRTCDESREGDC